MREVSPDSSVSPDYQVVLETQGLAEAKEQLEGLEEMDSPVVPDTPDRKVREDTPVSPARPLLLSDQSLWRKENLDSTEAAASPASLDPEVTKVCQGCLVARVCLDFLVTLSRVKDSQDSLVSPGNQALRASPDPREKLESWDFLACLDQGVTMVHLVSLATLENLVGPVEKVHLEKVLVIQEVQELKASLEIQASQVAVPLMALPVRVAFQEVQVFLERRELLVKGDGLE